MPLLPSLPETAHLSDLLVRFPKIIEPLMALNTAVLRGEGALSVEQRELIAAYISGLNACTFCYGSHKIYAVAFGVEEDLLDALVADLDSAPVDARLRPLLAYAKKLNTLPSRLTERDAQAVLEAGWSEQALVELVQVCAMFNFMNRLIEGTGVNFDYAQDPGRHMLQAQDQDALSDSYTRYAQHLADLIAART